MAMYCAVFQVWTGDMYFPRADVDQPDLGSFYQSPLVDPEETLDSPTVERPAKPVRFFFSSPLSFLEKAFFFLFFFFYCCLVDFVRVS